MKVNNKLKLYGCCYSIKGANRSVICDLQYGKMNFIPNDLHEFIELNQGKSLSDIYDFYNNEENETIDEYVNFLVENEYAFFTDNPDNFPALLKKWYSPAKITNAIIDIDSEIIYLDKEIISQLEKLGVIAIQLRLNDSISIDKLDKVLTLFMNSSIRSIELVLKYVEEYHSDLPNLALRHLRISYIIIHSSPNNSHEEHSHIVCFYTKDDIKRNTSFGPRLITHLAVNKQLFMEAQFHNTYLNKKVYINKNCEVSNAPGYPVLGNFNEKPLYDIVDSLLLNNLWDIKKDVIKICKDCEFRYFCVDSRIPKIDSLTKEYFHEESCEYNPFTSTWKHEQEN